MRFALCPWVPPSPGWVLEVKEAAGTRHGPQGQGEGPCATGNRGAAWSGTREDVCRQVSGRME